MGQGFITLEEARAGAAHSPGFDEVSDADVLLSIRRQSAIAATYIQGVKTLPLLQWGDDLRTAVNGLVLKDCLTSKGYQPSNPFDPIRQNAKDAMTWLRDVANQTATLVDCIDSSVDTSVHGGPVFTSRAPRAEFWRDPDDSTSQS